MGHGSRLAVAIAKPMQSQCFRLRGISKSRLQCARGSAPSGCRHSEGIATGKAKGSPLPTVEPLKRVPGKGTRRISLFANRVNRNVFPERDRFARSAPKGTEMQSQPWLDLGISRDQWDAIPNRTPKAPPRHREGRHRQRRPRTVARTRLAMSGFLPPIVAAGFTAAEIAVLTVIAMECRTRGFCILTLAELGRRSNACRTTCQNAIAWAARWGWITVKQRRIAADRNMPNLIKIIAPVWIAWLRLRPGPTRHWAGGFKNTVGSPVQSKKEAAEQGNGRKRGESVNAFMISWSG